MWWWYHWWVEVRWSVLVTGCWRPHPAFTFFWETACLPLVVYWDLQLLTFLTTISGAQCLKATDPRWMEVIVFIKKKTQYAPDSYPFMWSFSRTSVLNIIHMTYYHFTTENMGSCVFVSHEFFFHDSSCWKDECFETRVSFVSRIYTSTFLVSALGQQKGSTQTLCKWISGVWDLNLLLKQTHRFSVGLANITAA